MSQDYSRLYQSLSYHFKQVAYLTTALTHCSAGSPNNERLEFLGDALLSAIMADALFERFPVANEGELTRFRAKLVKRETLAEIAQNIALGQYLQLGLGEQKEKGWRRSSTLSNTLEAVLGAIYLDGGAVACKTVALMLWHAYLNKLSPKTIIKDPKTRLQEYLQANQQTLPVYRILTVEGVPHAQHFEVECVVPNLPSTRGKGDNRRRAEQVAAEKVLKSLNV